ncbi:MAG: HesA/MoeB/ThiF family protein [Promethearchaeota archaeon]
MTLRKDQLERYSRQIILKEIGGKGQEKLLNSRITIIGLGALGSPSAYYLAAAGIGQLTIIDSDIVDISNLHRQILHFTKDINLKKTSSALEKLNLLNPDCKVEIIDDRLKPSNVLEYLKGSDFVIEGSDNIATKLLTNDACISLKIPFTIAGVLRFHGQIMTVIPEQRTTCYRCIFGDISQNPSSLSCSQAGVMGMAPSILGSMEAVESIKYLLNIGELIINQLFFIDLLNNSFNTIVVYRDENCQACGENAKNLVKSYQYGSDLACQ